MRVLGPPLCLHIVHSSAHSSTPAKHCFAGLLLSLLLSWSSSSSLLLPLSLMTKMVTIVAAGGGGYGGGDEDDDDDFVDEERAWEILSQSFTDRSRYWA